MRPRRTGFWRAELAAKLAAPAPPADPAEVVDADPSTGGTTALDRRSDVDRIIVRSRTSARVHGRHVIAGNQTKIKGRVAPAGERRRVTLIAGGKRVKTRTDRRGRFTVSWRAPSTGRYKLRVRATANASARGSGKRLGRVTAYRGAGASWYGPGFYGNHTSCGQILSPGTIGVAHKYLPCGTRLTLRYRSRSIRVRVIDTGPFVPGREFDLTEAVKNRLGFPDVGTVLTSR